MVHTGLLTLAVVAATAAGPYADASPFCAASDPLRVAFTVTRSGYGGSGDMILTMAASPFGVTVARDGAYRTDVVLDLRELRRRDGIVYVVWAATPELDSRLKIGSFSGGSAQLAAELEWNQFLVFVSAERSADVDRWQGPIVLTAMSPSGRMHPKAGHGVFEAYSYLC